MKKKIFLTGHKGFIGGAIIKRFELYNCDQNNVLDKSKEIILQYSYISKDNKDNWINLLKDVDCIIHCGGLTNIKRKTEESLLEIFRKANTEPTKILAEEAVKLGVKRFIFLSSIGVNGTFTYNEKIFTFKDIPMPAEDYAISKWEAEQELWKIAQLTGLEVVIIRPPLVYGEGVKGNFLRLLDIVYKQMPLPFAKINNLRSFIGLDNLIDLIICCIDHPKAAGKTFLVSDGEDLSTPDLIIKLSKFMDKSPRLFQVPQLIIQLISRLVGKSLEIKRSLGSLRVDNSYTCEILEWSPVLSLDESLEKTVRWYLKNR